MDKVSQQALSRLAELAVEAELTKKDGSPHKDTTLRQIKFNDKVNKISSGYKIKWKNYLNNWELLEN